MPVYYDNLSHPHICCLPTLPPGLLYDNKGGKGIQRLHLPPQRSLQGKNTHCLSPGVPRTKYWIIEITRNVRNPCHNKDLQRGKRVCYSYLPQWGISDGGGVQDRALQKVIKDTQDRGIQAIKVTTPLAAYQGLNLSALNQMLTNSPLQRWANTTLQVFHKTYNHTQTCWMCLPFSQRAYLATPIPLTWEAPENLKTNTSVLIGPLATGIHLTNANNLICTVPEDMNGTSLYGRNITLKSNTTLCSTLGVFYLVLIWPTNA